MKTSPAATDASAAAARGIACMVAGSVLVTLNDTMLKWLAGDYPTGQLVFIRGVFVFIPIAVLAWRAGGLRSLRIVSLRGQAARALLMTVSTFVYVTALGLMPLADIVAVTFAGPLFTTALATPLLGERVGWRRWSAVGVGFVGILVMTRPGAGALDWIVLLPLASSFAGSLRDIVTRRISRRETSVAILFYSTLAITLSGLATAPFGWQPIPAADVALLAIAALLLGSAHYLAIEAFRLAEAAVVAPFRYTNMLWAVLFGYLVWGDLPDRWIVAGAALVLGSGLYILHRETRRRGA